MVSFPPFCWNHRHGFFFDTPSHEPVLVCLCVRACLCLSLSLSIYIYIHTHISLFFFLSFSFLSFLCTPAPHPPTTPSTPAIAWARPNIKQYSCDKHIIYCFQNMCFLGGNVEYVEYVQKPFSKNVSFCGNVEYVEYFECF